MNVAYGHFAAAPGSPITPAGRLIVIFLASSAPLSSLNATQTSRWAPAGASVAEGDVEHVPLEAIGLATSPEMGTSAAPAIPAIHSGAQHAAANATIHRPIVLFSPDSTAATSV